MKNIGTLIHQARKRASLTLTELAPMVDISPSTLSIMENGLQKTPVSPAELVRISDVLRDHRMLDDYCTECPIRTRIVVKKFPPLNNIHHSPQIAAMKTAQKLSEAAEGVQSMLAKMLRKDFHTDPEYTEFRDATILKALDAKRGLEILMTQFLDAGLVSTDELKGLERLQQQLCIAKGHHIENEQR